MGTIDYLAHLKIGEAYERPKLASLWGLAGFQAISRGVFTPAKTNLLFLFVTRVKQTCLTPYQDFLCDGILQWEGEKQHATDRRIANASLNGDEIHLFYREQHHMPFTFHGRVILVTFIIPDLDALFDKGLITFQPNGAMDLSPSFDPTDQRKMRIDHAFRLRHVTDGMQPYLEYHREHRFVC